VKEFRKSLYICRSYDQKSSVLFFETQCITVHATRGYTNNKTLQKDSPFKTAVSMQHTLWKIHRISIHNLVFTCYKLGKSLSAGMWLNMCTTWHQQKVFYKRSNEIKCLESISSSDL